MIDRLPKFLTLNGDGVTTNAIVDYSGAAVRYWVEAEDIRIIPRRLIIEIDDTDSFLNTYGNLASLTNGIEIKVESFVDGVWTTLLDLLHGKVVRNTLEWSHVGGILTAINTTTTTPGTRVDFDLTDKFKLEPNTGARLTVRLFDNFVGLDRHTFLLT